MNEERENGIAASDVEAFEEGLMVTEDHEGFDDETEYGFHKVSGPQADETAADPEEGDKRPFYQKLFDPPNRWRTICVGLLLIAIILLVFPVANFASDPQTYTGTIATLDEKKNNMLGLSASTVGVATLASMLPPSISNAGTPIANALMNLNSNILIILAVIYMEKFLITTLAFAGVRFLIPLSLACFIVAIVAFRHERILEIAKQAGKKILIIGLALTFVIPVSVFVTDLIDSTYAANIEVSNQQAQQATEEIAAELKEESEADGREAEKSILESVGEAIGSTASGIANGVTGAATSALDSAKTFLTNAIDTVAVMIVTSCIVPILVLALFIWLLNSVIGMKIDTPIKGRNHSFFGDEKKGANGKTSKGKTRK